MKRLLFIAYHFPPHGGAGVQRSLKFVKYLPAAGIEPVVLTGLGGTDRKWNPADGALEDEIPPDITVVRTEWPVGPCRNQPAAEKQRFAHAVQLIEERKLEAIFVSMSPFSDASFGARLAARCGIPWIADLRDPWALDEFQVYRTRWHRQRTFNLMRRALQSASLIVMNTPEAAAALRRVYPEFFDRTVSVTNGYDAADFPPLAAPVHNEFFTIVHAGFLHTTAGLRQRQETWRYRLLGRVEPGVELLPRSHYYLLQALALWTAEEPAVLPHVRLLLVGEPRPLDRELVNRSPVRAIASFTGYLPHAESLQTIRTADLLFLPMHKLPSERRATIVPAKTYDYLASGRPILAPVPDGDAKDFLVRSGCGLVCAPDAIDRMVAHLSTQYRRWSEGLPSPKPDFEYIGTFERRALARQLAEYLQNLPQPPAPQAPAAAAADGTAALS